ncbi:MAG TPA: DegT/DnrJ/EryC1/StrS family aminotransferase [Myxococcota bacterium]|nr:DegT/DnrJ/EryC1/StrS family aminotransferase [Myxococcota bacterium]
MSAPGDADRPALEGGLPVRDTLLPFFRVELGSEEEEAAVRALRSGWISTGPECERFEADLAGFLGLPPAQAVSVASCTAGLHLALRAAGVGPGDEVITSPMTFPASANAILHAGAVPVFADVVPAWLTLDPAAVRAAVGPRTRAILPVHFAGWPCEMDALGGIAAEHDLAIVEDAAHAIGATWRGRPAGTLGDAAAFSFYATKNLTTCEGGLVATAHPEWARRMRVERLHGIDLDASQRDGHDYRHWESVSLGWKYNLNDLQAAIGRVQLARLPEQVRLRREADSRYRAALAASELVEPISGPAGAETAAHLFPVRLRTERLRVGRDHVLRALLAENVGVGVHFRALPLHRFFRDAGHRPEAVPAAVEASHRLLSLPLHPGIKELEQQQVVEALLRILRWYAA